MTLQSRPEVDVFTLVADESLRVPWVAEYECQTPLYWKIISTTEAEFFDIETLSWFRCPTTSSVAPFLNFNQRTGGSPLNLTLMGVQLQIPNLIYTLTKYLNLDSIIKSEFDPYGVVGSIALNNHQLWSNLTIELTYDGKSLVPKSLELKRKI
jgi:hypothetical protein